MQITDEMVKAALTAFYKKMPRAWGGEAYESSAMRSVLEAVLGVSTEIDDLRSDYLRRHKDACDRAEKIIQLTDCIEDLAGALIHIATMDVYTRDGEKPAHEIMREVAFATLEKWGLK